MHLITVDVKVNGQKIRFEIDTGAAMSILSQEDQKKLFPDATLRETSTRLRTYTGCPWSREASLMVFQSSFT